jgi:hypothetical protein
MSATSNNDSSPSPSLPVQEPEKTKKDPPQKTTTTSMPEITPKKEERKRGRESDSVKTLLIGLAISLVPGVLVRLFKLNKAKISSDK